MASPEVGWFRSTFAKLSHLLLRPVLDIIGSMSEQQRATELSLVASSARYSDPRCLTRYGYRCASQNDEDGIIDEVFQRIGTTNRYFVEFGVGNGLENNTFSLLLGGWNGLWIEADPGSAQAIRSEFSDPIKTGHLQFLESFITAENIEGLFESGSVPSEPDLLSIDIDGNDYWVWRAIQRFRPRVVVIEYNARLGRTARIVRQYDPSARWDETIHYGASLGALEDLGREKGYALVGCGIGGVNAFFVRTDCVAGKFLEPFTAANHYEPPRVARHPVRWARFQKV